MKNCFYPMMLILVISSLLMSCEDDGTEILFTTTVNVLEQVSSGYPPGWEEWPIAGYYLGHGLPPDALLRTSSAEVSEWILPGAGAEFGICSDGETYSRDVNINFLRIVTLIGDTGAEDVSDDADCKCDSRIESIEFYPFTVLFDGVPDTVRVPFMTLSGDFFCPNSVEGHHIAGDRDFGGDVNTSISVTLRVLPDNSALVADITLHMIEV
jgi:hypothetical protein